MNHDRFDALTRALAAAPSRRQALKLLGGSLVGGLLASLGLGSAAAKGGNSACAQFCAQVFGADTPAALQCTSDAAHHTGLCYTCGPAAPASHPPLCGQTCCTAPANATAICNGSACDFICNTGFTKCNGACIPSTDCCNCDGFCVDGICQSCLQPGQSGCTTNEDCCSGELCFEGTCYQSCFTAGTLIVMADGTSRPIQHVLVGDRVLGSDGRVNQVVEVERPVLGHRYLYALNGSDFFVTAEHPFLTEAGWKAIDPAALAAEHSVLRVGRLTVGDRLLALMAMTVPVGGGGPSSAEEVDMEIDAVPLHSLVGRPEDPATPLYNLRLDGNHTYFANDLVVHNK